MENMNLGTPKISTVPMIDRTDRHFRYFCRLMRKRTLLYTEVLTAQFIINGDRKKQLDFDSFEKPVVLQIGFPEGSPKEYLKTLNKRPPSINYFSAATKTTLLGAKLLCGIIS